MPLAARRNAIAAAPQSFPALERSLFADHFALGEDLGDRDVIDRHVAAARIDVVAMHAALDDSSGYVLIERSERLGKSPGIPGTPALS